MATKHQQGKELPAAVLKPVVRYRVVGDQPYINSLQEAALHCETTGQKIIRVKTRSTSRRTRLVRVFFLQ